MTQSPKKVHFKLKKIQLYVDYKRGPLKWRQNGFLLKDVKVYTRRMVIIKMIIKWYSIAKLTSGKRIKHWYKAFNRIKWISMITETCNPVRGNSQPCLHLNTKLSVYEHVYPRVCAVKSDENTRRSWRIHRQRGALSRAPFRQLIR